MSIKLIKEKEEIFPINIKLKSVIVKRDYSLNGTLEVFFSDYNISVIYGENGCGKTTILRLINAFLSQNDSVFSQEKVKEMSIRFLSDGMEKEVVVSKKERKEIITDIQDIICTYITDVHGYKHARLGIRVIACRSFSLVHKTRI